MSVEVEFSGKPSSSSSKKKKKKKKNCWKNSRTLPQRPSPNNPWAHRHQWDQLWSLPGDVKRKFEHMPHCHEICSTTLDKWSKAVVCKCLSWANEDSRLWVSLGS
jgi:hypothetical protein